MLNLIVKPQYGPGARREWKIVAQVCCAGSGVRGQGSGECFIAYARSYTGARRAIEEIQASVARLDAGLFRTLPYGRVSATLTQQAIDGAAAMNAARRPFGPLRRLFWHAARSH